jgi:hypothetical protein
MVMIMENSQIEITARYLCKRLSINPDKEMGYQDYRREFTLQKYIPKERTLTMREKILDIDFPIDGPVLTWHFFRQQA